MAESLQMFVTPQCLVESTPDGKLAVNQTVLQELKKLEEQVVVVVIAGPYRTGKSYLMNRLADLRTGFALGSTVQSKTKGIWIWARRHPTDANKYLILLDTEGLGDVEKGSKTHDNMLLCLSVLLSSTLVYNVMAVINNDSLENLHFVTELSKHIQMRSDQRENDDSNFDFYFPDFIYVLRDFFLELDIDGRKVSADEYLEHSLMQRDDKVKGHTQIRQAIRKYFRNRKCFTFVSPAGGKKLRYLDELPNDKLDEDFVQQTNEFVRHIYHKCPVKQVKGKPVTGTMLASLLEVYVEQISNGGVPYVENAVDTMAWQQNTQAKEHAVSFYYQLMTETLIFPILDEDAISEYHNFCLIQAIEIFLKESIFDENHAYQRVMNEEILEKYKELVEQNVKLCKDKCTGVLKELHQPIEMKVKSGGYTKNGGFQEYRNDIKEMREKFEAVHSELAIKIKHVMLEYLHSLSSEEDAIFQADKTVTAAEKQVEADRQKALEAECSRAQDEQDNAMQEQMTNESKRAHEENVERLEKKMEQEREASQKHFDGVLQHRLREQEQLVLNGFANQGYQLQSHINDLQGRISSQSSGGGGCAIL